MAFLGSPGDALQCGLAVNLSGSLGGGGRWVGVRTVSASWVMWPESHLLAPTAHSSEGLTTPALRQRRLHTFRNEITHLKASRSCHELLEFATLSPPHTLHTHTLYTHTHHTHTAYTPTMPHGTGPTHTQTQAPTKDSLGLWGVSIRSAMLMSAGVRLTLETPERQRCAWYCTAAFWAEGNSSRKFLSSSVCLFVLRAGLKAQLW